jgi:hypothetical protein
VRKDRITHKKSPLELTKGLSSKFKNYYGNLTPAMIRNSNISFLFQLRYFCNIYAIFMNQKRNIFGTLRITICVMFAVTKYHR